MRNCYTMLFPHESEQKHQCGTPACHAGGCSRRRPYSTSSYRLSHDHRPPSASPEPKRTPDHYISCQFVKRAVEIIFSHVDCSHYPMRTSRYHFLPSSRAAAKKRRTLTVTDDGSRKGQTFSHSRQTLR